MKSLRRLSVAAAATWLFTGLGWCDPSTGQATGPASFGTTVVIPSGLRGLIYYMRTGESYLPDFSRMKPVGVIYTTSLDIPAQDWSFGFPGVTSRFEWFAIDYHGRFWIDTPGDYEFSLTSDDGSKLYIDDRVKINLDGTHEAQTEFAQLHLDCGVHTIRVSYFQGPRYQLALILSVHGGTRKKWRIFSTDEFKPPPNPEDWMCAGVRVAYDLNRRELPDAATLRKTIEFEAEAQAALSANPRPQDVTVWPGAFSFWGSATGSQTSVAIGVPGTSLSATRTTRGAPVNKLHVALFVFIKGADGREVDKFTVDASHDFSDEEYAAARPHPLVFSHPVHLPVGRYIVQAAVMDREGRRTGTAEIAVASKTQKGGIGLSSLVLVDRVEPVNGSPDAADPLIFEGKRVVPHLSPTLTAGESLYVYFVVYPDSSNPSKASLQVQFLSGGQPVAEQTADLPASDASGAIPMFVSMAARPGDDGLRITVRQGNDSASEDMRYQVPEK
jgi:hypothetical protein